MKDKKIPAIPPEDYIGSIAQWCMELVTRGLWNQEGWYGDVQIDSEIWWEILETCENTN